MRSPMDRPIVLADDLKLEVEIRQPLPEETEALRRRQLAGIRRFLEAVLANREAAGLSDSRGSLGALESAKDDQEKSA
jgi:hypothetical protein